MKISLSWLREFVDLPESVDELRLVLDDLGLVVEGIARVGEGLEDVVVARIDDVRAIEGADRVRLVTVDAGNGPLDIVCGATNFAVGNHVPLAPVGAVLPGGFEIAQRKMRGVTSNGMLCSSRELGLSEDHAGLMILDDVIEPIVGVGLLEALAIDPDVIFDISVEGNRPDAWSVLGVARDLATRFGRPLRAPAVAKPNVTMSTDSVARAGIDAPDLCGRLTVAYFRNIVVGPSPAWIARRVESAGMRSISNVVDASNIVMLELGQPNHPYDASAVAGRTIRVRRARTGEHVVTLDGTRRPLAMPGRGLGDSGDDCVIVDGDDHILGLAGIMGGASSEISATTTEVLFEAAYFDPMTVARSSKRHGLRSEASNRFERGVDPQHTLRAVGRFVELLRESCPDLEWFADPLDVIGELPSTPTIELRDDDVERALGVALPADVVERILVGLGFSWTPKDHHVAVTPPSARLDVRSGTAGRADVIEEIARLYGYRRLPRRTPTWPHPGGINERQKFRRRTRDVIVDLGAFEAWTPTLGSDADFDLLQPDVDRVRVTNPLASEESVLRSTLLTGLVRAWSKNFERGTGDVVLAEIGTVFHHPHVAGEPRRTKGGAGGTVSLALPAENERVSIVLARPEDDATTAVAFVHAMMERLGLEGVSVRNVTAVPPGLHPTRVGAIVDDTSGGLLGYVGELDPAFVGHFADGLTNRRLAVVDVDFDALANEDVATRRSPFVKVPSRYPSATIDLAFVAPNELHAADLARALRATSAVVESVELFDVYRGAALPTGTRSLAYSIRLTSPSETLSEKQIAVERESLIASAGALGATLR